MIDLKGQVALVTGGSRGIGRACALKLAAAGADVVVNYVSSRTAADSVGRDILQLGRRTAVIKADVSEPEDVTEMVNYVREQFGRLDILISNAATGGFRPLTETTPQQFKSAVRVNTLSLLSLVQTSLPLLQRPEGRAKVVVLSSAGSVRAIPAYAVVGGARPRWKA
jgi:enoyl-[acyl-carrier protein] reductase III